MRRAGVEAALLGGCAVRRAAPRATAALLAAFWGAEVAALYGAVVSTARARAALGRAGAGRGAESVCMALMAEFASAAAYRPGLLPGGAVAAFRALHQARLGRRLGRAAAEALFAARYAEVARDRAFARRVLEVVG